MKVKKKRKFNLKMKSRIFGIDFLLITLKLARYTLYNLV
jgi:hypothetical protein